MGKIDTQGWGEFRIGDYFTVEYGKYRPKDELGIGNVNYVTSSGINNGISDTYSIADHQGNCITVASDGAMGASFYQEEPFSTSNIVSTLTPLPNIPLNRYIAQFICTVIYNKKSEFGWLGFKMSVDRVRNLIIRLPQTPSGDPDWKYMESYMLNLKTAIDSSLNKLLSTLRCNKKIDVREWKEFRIGDLFEVKISKSVDKGSLDFVNKGEFDFIGRTPLDNGIQGKLHKLEFPPNNACTYSIAQIGAHICQYRDNEWYSSQNIFILIPLDSKSDKANHFLTSIITKTLESVYGTDTYSKYPTIKTLPEMIIKLPVTSSGTPDWAYMENYMKQIESKVSGYIEKLETV